MRRREKMTVARLALPQRLEAVCAHFFEQSTQSPDVE